jgi:predicted nucleic acid-binding protein
VGKGLILETTFLIDLERELAAGQSGPAQAFLAANATSELFITFTVAGELAAGRTPADRSRWERSIASLQVLESNADVCWEFGRLHRFLRLNGLLIGTNDLWIAATALAYDKSVVTRNIREFQRVPGLTVLGYRT